MMSTFFIHTFELVTGITFDEFDSLKGNLKYWPENGYCNCTEYKAQGIILRFRKCTENESMTYGNIDLLSLDINPSRLLEENTYHNCIYTLADFRNALVHLDDLIHEIFDTYFGYPVALNDFTLKRVDLTRDIHGIKKHYLPQIFKLFRQMPMHAGFQPNFELQKNCKDFNPDYSLNIVNKNRAVEFVLYDKQQAALDQRYPNADQKYYENTLRMELRCQRGAVNHYQKTNDLGPCTDTLLMIYCDAQNIVEKLYRDIFMLSTGSCFLKMRGIRGMIDRYEGGKKKRAEKMISLAKAIRKHPDCTADDAGKSVLTEKQYARIIGHYEELGISPIPLTEIQLGFLQSPDSLLGFAHISNSEYTIYRYASKHSDKEVGFLGDNNA